MKKKTCGPTTGKTDLHSPQGNFYCSQKFTDLTIDLEKRLSNSCSSATPEKLDITWVTQNPGQIFNTPGLHQDRIDMLANTPVDSCRDACWKPENDGLHSRRIAMKSYIPIHSDINQLTPRRVDVILGSTCNLTCSYCCKQYSSAWYRDIDKNGPYFDSDRYNVTAIDTIISKIGHADLRSSPGSTVIMDEIKKLDHAEEIRFAGGEPFLYNEFPDLLNGRSPSKFASFHTGLGVNNTRLQNQINRITQRENLLVYVSAENCDDFYEFNRFGNSYKNFLDNLKLLVDAGFSVKFNSVVSNLTIFGLTKFVETFQDIPKNYRFCNDPEFLRVNVLDGTSKEQLIESLENTQIEDRDLIISNIKQPCSEQSKMQCAHYLKEFSTRRDINLDIFPEHFLQWLGLSYVV